MKHMLYALFRDAGEAEAAVQEVQTAGLAGDECHLVVHRGEINPNDLDIGESDSRRGLFTGLIAGAIARAIAGWLLSGPMQVLPLGLMSAIGLGIVAGLIFGGIGGALYGAGLQDTNLQRLGQSRHHGDVLITAETENLSARDVVDQIFKKHGARFAT